MLALNALARNWWLVALRGLAAVVFGLLAIIWPGTTLGVLVLFFGAYALADGVLALVAALMGGTGHRLAMALTGVVGILAGLAAFLWPGVTALVLLYIIAYWAILTGILQIVTAVRLRRSIPNEWSLIVAGALSVLFGVLLIVAPGAGALAVITVIGIYAILFGAMQLVLSWRLRGVGQSLTAPGSAGAAAV